MPDPFLLWGENCKGLQPLFSSNEMGFDWTVHLNLDLYIDRTTGLPYTLDKSWQPRPFNAEEWRVPERFLPFMEMRGWHLMEYVGPIDREEDRTNANTFTLLYYFPEWESIKNSKSFEATSWDEAKHTLFKEFLEWADEKGGFTAAWSY